MPAPETDHDRSPLAPELRDRVGFVLKKAGERIHGEMWATFRKFGVEGPQLGILLLISRRGSAMRQIDIAQALRIDRTTAMHWLDEMEAAGLIRRQPHPEDRRAHVVEITADGQKTLDRITPVLEKVEQQFLSCLSIAERETLLELLGRLVTA